VSEYSQDEMNAEALMAVMMTTLHDLRNKSIDVKSAQAVAALGKEVINLQKLGLDAAKFVAENSTPENEIQIPTFLEKSVLQIAFEEEEDQGERDEGQLEQWRNAKS